MKTCIVITLTFEGVHSWPKCPIESVSFLRYPHRHQFYVTCKKRVSHNDRDIEIICFKQTVLSWVKEQFQYQGVALDLGDTSCETLCEMLVNEFNLCYCSVLEDNENGAEITL